MSSIALNKEMNIEVKVRLIGKGNDEPVTGNEYAVRLYDKDIFNDDFLGESSLDNEGVAKFLFSQKDFSGIAGLDDKPDFYFVVFKDKEPIFKSKVMSNLDLSNIEEFVMAEGEVIDLGTFLIDN
ncbi:MAG: hypothetical protein Q8891_05145 [Bacteroidota bacterium]|jgi:hypothetical protein|nr:hypothetical protein [Bacteroidota bacterium]